MNKTQAFAAGTVLALAALTGCTSNTTPAPEAEPTPTNIHTYAGDSTTAFAFTDPTTAWEDLTPEVQQGMISKATAQNQALVIWGEHVEWTGLHAEIPAGQKQWVERMVERYDATDAPVVFVVGLGSDDLYVERQNLDAPADEQTVEKVTYNTAP